MMKIHNKNQTKGEHPGMASKQQADEFFYQSEMEIREKWKFLLFGLQLENEEIYCDGP